MATIRVPYENIDTLMGNPKMHESKKGSFEGRTELRKRFLAVYLGALWPNKQDVNTAIAESQLDKSFSIHIWDDKLAHKVFDKLVNFKGDIIFFPVTKDNVESTVEWLRDHSSPEKFEITTLMGSDLSLIFWNRDDALLYKLAYDPEAK